VTALTEKVARGGRPEIAWLWVVVWTGVVLWAGGEAASAATTSRFVGRLLHWLLPDASFETIARIHLLIRKGAHLGEYGLLAVLALAGLRSSFRTSLPRLAAGALAWVALVAACDEARQALVHSRTGSPWDVALDVVGGLLALALAIVYTRVMRAGPSTAERG
jgi:VanZ family protein